jgi:hypothetical protein
MEKMDIDLIVTPELYAPVVDKDGNYVDKLPKNIHGIQCPCSRIKLKVYETNAKLSQHFKTKTHQVWLVTMNENKANHYVDNILKSETIKNQQKIIQRLENDVNKKILTIDYLSEQLYQKKNETIDLLDF